MTPLAKTIVKWTVLTALVAYVVFMGRWSASEAADTVCPGFEVVMGNRWKTDTVTRDGVAYELGRFPDSIVGQRIRKLRLDSMERYLRRLNNLETVECAVASDGRLMVYVEPIRPELRVFASDGSSYYVNREGKRIDARARFYVDVPIVYGDFTPQFPVTAVMPVVRFVTSDPKLAPLVTAFVARDPHNILLVPAIRGHMVNFGDTNRLERKRDALLTAYRRLLPRRGWMTYDTISVKFRDQIVASRRDKTPLWHGADMTEEVDMEEATLPDAPQNASGRSAQHQTRTPEETQSPTP